MWDLVENPEDQFSHNIAHIKVSRGSELHGCDDMMLCRFFVPTILRNAAKNKYF